MKRRGLLLCALSLAACPPQLNGAVCENDAQCPNQQHCVAPTSAGKGTDGGSFYGSCVDGERSGKDYAFDSGIDAGFDAGPTCPGNPLAGALTLNGGFSLPTQNQAWVDVWDHPPTLVGPDGGRPYEHPTIQVQVAQGTGAFSVPGLTPGKVYWVSGQYDLTLNLDAGDLVDDAVSAPTAFAVGFPPACSLPLDVSTLYRCEVVTAFNTLISSGAYVLAAIADVRDITNGTELTTGVVAQAQVPDAGAAENLALTLENDPTVFDGGVDGGVIYGGGDYTNGPPVYAKAGNLPFALADVGGVFNAFPGAYDFTINGVGYKSGSCAVNVMPQASQPILDTSNLVWGDAGIVITWKSADDATTIPGAQIDYYDLLVLGVTDNNTLTVTWASPALPQNTSYHSYTVPLSACPVGRGCAMVVFSARDIQTSLGANPLLESLEESGSIYPALPLTPESRPTGLHRLPDRVIRVAQGAGARVAKMPK